MSNQALVIRLAFFAAVVMAWVLVRIAPHHRPAARALTVFFLIDLVRPLLLGHAPRVVDAALFLGAYAVQAALALRVFARVPPSILSAPGAVAHLTIRVLTWAVRSAPWGTLWLWAAAVYTLALRWDLAVAVYKAGFFVALAVQVIAVALFVRRRPRELPNPAQGVSALLALSAVADLRGPWFHVRPDSFWGSGAATALLTWIAVTAWEGWRWRVCTRR